MKKEIVINIVCALLVFLFVYAAVSKLTDFQSFKNDMFNQPLPDFLKPVLVWLVPLTELTIAALLILETTRQAGLYASLVLMAAFTAYTAVVLLNFFNYIPCSCGGIIKSLSWQQHLLLNLFFLVITIAGIIWYPSKIKNYKTHCHNKNISCMKTGETENL